MLYFLKGTYPFLDLESNSIMQKLVSKEDLETKFFDANANELDKFIKDVSMNSLFGTRELLILKRAESLKSSGIEKLLQSLQQYNLAAKEIIISYEEKRQFDKVLKDYEVSKKTLDYIAELGEVLECSKEANEKKILKLIKTKLNITDKEAKTLMEALGSDFYKLENELEKIINFLDGSDYSYAKIQNIINIDEEYNIKDLVEGFLKKKDLSRLYTFLASNKDSLSSILYILAEELITLIKINAFVEKAIFSYTMDYNSFKLVYEDYKNYFLTRSKTPSHPYPIFLKLNSISLRDNKFLQRKLKEVLDLEYAFKSGQSDIEIIELFLLSFYK